MRVSGGNGQKCGTVQYLRTRENKSVPFGPLRSLSGNTAQVRSIVAWKRYQGGVGSFSNRPLRCGGIDQMHLVRSTILLLVPLLWVNASALDIVFSPGAATNTPDAAVYNAWLPALNRAALPYEVALANPVTIRIVVVPADLASDVAGAAVPKSTLYTYDRIASALAGYQVQQGTEGRFYVDGQPRSYRYVTVPRAIQKAVGYLGDDGRIDGEIRVSRQLAKYHLGVDEPLPDNKVHAVSVLTHEIGHILGFSSGVDYRDSGSDAPPTPMDFYRFSDDSIAYGRANLGIAFLPDLSIGHQLKYFLTEFPAHLPRPGGKFCAHALVACKRVQFSTGTNYGNGNQASHWRFGTEDFVSIDKMGNVTIQSGPIGIMDPGIASGVVERISGYDMDLLTTLGWRRATIVSGPASGSTSGAADPTGWRECVPGAEDCNVFRDLEVDQLPSVDDHMPNPPINVDVD